MRKFNKPLVLTAAAAAVGISALGSIAITHAAGTSSSNGPMAGLVQAISSKFHLSTSDVQTVVDEQKTKLDTQRQQKFRTTLDQAVTSGSLTQAQEDLIIAKQAEEQTFRASLEGMSMADRQTALQTNRTNLQAWATANNIPQQYIPGGPGGRGGPGHHGFMGMPAPAAASTSPATTN